MHVNGCQHRHRCKRANSATPFCNHEIETAVAGGQRRSNRVDLQPDQFAQKSDRRRNHKLQSKASLLNRAERNQEDQESARKKNDPGNLLSPKIKNAAVNQKRQRREREARLQATRTQHEKENADADEKKAVVVAVLRRARDL